MNKQSLLVVLGLSLIVAPVCFAHDTEINSEPAIQAEAPEIITPQPEEAIVPENIQETVASVVPEATDVAIMDTANEQQQPGEEELQALFKQILDELEQEQQKEKAKENKAKEVAAPVVAE